MVSLKVANDFLLHDFLSLFQKILYMVVEGIYQQFFSFPQGTIMTLTKADLAQKVYQRHENITKQQSIEAVEAFLRLSKNSLISGSDLLLSGFGKFNVRDKGARRGRNPQTGDELTLDSRRVVTFKPSGILRNLVNGE